MQPKAILKMAVDGVMTVLILNRGWLKNLRKGRYTPYRVLQTALAGLVLLSMLGQMVSALLISREVFAFLPFTGGVGFGRTLHMPWPTGGLSSFRSTWGSTGAGLPGRWGGG